MILEKVISGGQTGSDQGALIAARDYGIPTGGWMPKGFRTLEGNCPSFAEEFNMVEHPAENYKDRTYANVCMSDGTLRFYIDPLTAGERCTLNAIRLFKKPYTDVQLLDNMDRDEFIVAPLEEVRDWLLEHRIKVLNVAGNSEQNAPGI